MGLELCATSGPAVSLTNKLRHFIDNFCLFLCLWSIYTPINKVSQELNESTSWIKNLRTFLNRFLHTILELWGYFKKWESWNYPSDKWNLFNNVSKFSFFLIRIKGAIMEVLSIHSIVCLNVKELLARTRRHIWSLSTWNDNSYVTW